ncbi:MAG TPA: CocE/NonD family hydrolase [Mycobacteriales bacterium]|nr:CocE/NonD family hydrolase [Mycobacteriales bacterium]
MRRLPIALSLVALSATLLPAAQAAKPGATPSGPPATGKPAVTAGAPFDYVKQLPKLSKVRFETAKEKTSIPAADGTKLYTEVTRPTKAGKYPVILELSPYHGTLADREGTRIFPGPVDASNKKIGLTGYFAPRGYAVVMVDLRGTGRSGGCLDHMGPKDQSDAKAVVEWAASQPWSNGRVGMTGHSYVGSTPQMAAAQNPKGLVTIVPSAGLGAMYHHEFQDGVPYNLQWAGPLFAYEQLTVTRHLPPQVSQYMPAQVGPTGDDFGSTNTANTGCGGPQSAGVTGEAYMSGQEVGWHRERDFRKGVTAWKGSVFAVHGVNDNAARIAALDWFHARNGRAGDKAWIGQWDHGSGCCPTRRGDQFTAVLHAWFDKTLAKRPGVNTGPPAEIFMNDERVLTGKAWPMAPSRRLNLGVSSKGELGRTGEAGTVQYVADGRGFTSEGNTGKVEFTTEPLATETVLAGLPKLRLSVTVFGERIHLIGSLYDVDEGGKADLISKAGWAIQPELRDGHEKLTPVIPGTRMDIDLVGQAQAHVVKKGHKLKLVISSSHPDKVPTFANGAVVQIHTGSGATSVSLPILDRARLYKDVPLTGIGT